MKKTQFTDLITTIRKTSVSFTAIVVFIALGLGFYSGISWSVDHTEKSFNSTYQAGKMQTLLVTDPLGLTEEEIAGLKEIDGIDEAEGCNIVYRFYHLDGERFQAAVWQITENTDLLFNVEGELPSAAGQIAVLRSWADENNIRLGDTIELESRNGVDYSEFKPVRSVSQWDGEDIGSLSSAAETTDGLLSGVYTITAFVDSTVYLSTNPSAHGTCPLNGLYVEAAFFVSEHDMSPEQFGGYTSAALYSNELSSINCFSDDYKARSKELGKKVQSVINEWDRQLIDDFSDAVDLCRRQLDALELSTGAQSDEGESLYTCLDNWRDELNGEDSLSYVTEICDNNAFLTGGNLLSITKNLKKVFGITFLAVGIFICYSIISRLVADSSVLMGTRRSLGFYRRELLVFYIYYSGAAVLLGGIIGTLLGVFAIEAAFTGIYSTVFTFVKLPLVFSFNDIVPVFLIYLAVIFFVTIVTCIGKTKEKAISLLRGEQYNSEKFVFLQKSRVFKSLSLLNQTVLLNLFRDKRRVAGMIIGIAGSTMLMSAGMSFYMNFTTAFKKQFTDYYSFDCHICYDSSSEDASQEIREVLERYSVSYAELYCSNLILDTPDGGSNAPKVLVPDDTESLAEVMSFNTLTEKGVSYDSGVWLSDFYHYAFDAPVGSLLELKTLNGKEAEVPVDCYYKYHLTTPTIVMDKHTYKESFGSEAAPNSFFAATNGMDLEKLDEELQKIEGYIYSYDFYDSNLYSFSTEKTVATAFAVVFIVMSVIMALMIIINLMNVYISEKKNELIILMINGYSKKYTKRYIYRDTILLTGIGIVIGLAGGAILGNMVLTALETSSLRMIHGISWPSCIASAIIIAAFTALICSLSMRKIDNFKLSDINNE